MTRPKVHPSLGWTGSWCFRWRQHSHDKQASLWPKSEQKAAIETWIYSFLNANSPFCSSWLRAFVCSSSEDLYAAGCKSTMDQQRWDMVYPLSMTSRRFRSCPKRLLSIICWRTLHAYLQRHIKFNWIETPLEIDALFHPSLGCKCYRCGTNILLEPQDKNILKKMSNLGWKKLKTSKYDYSKACIFVLTVPLQSTTEELHCCLTTYSSYSWWRHRDSASFVPISVILLSASNLNGWKAVNLHPSQPGIGSCV